MTVFRIKPDNYFGDVVLAAADPGWASHFPVRRAIGP